MVETNRCLLQRVEAKSNANAGDDGREMGGTFLQQVMDTHHRTSVEQEN